MAASTTVVRKYEGEWVIVVQSHEDGYVTIRYEDDRTNTHYRVFAHWLK